MQPSTSSVSTPVAQEIARLFEQALQTNIIVAFKGFWRAPVRAQSLMEADFFRIADPCLVKALEDLHQDPHLNKVELNNTLLQKYGIDHLEAPVEQVNAYSALPDEESADYFLHLYFQKPFLLFGITKEERTHYSVHDREWLWGKPWVDSAPLFRTMIQYYILSSILKAAQEKDFTGNIVELGSKKTALWQKLQQQLKMLLGAIRIQESNKFTGNSKGLWGDRECSPNLVNMLSHFALGRLLFGQTLTEIHHHQALQFAKRAYSLKYLFFWVGTHLNVAPAFFWVGIFCHIFYKQSISLKQYVTGEISFWRFLDASFGAIPNTLIFLMCIPLIFMNWVYGLSSLPFTLIRSLCIYGKFPVLKSYSFLKILDRLELCKDIYCSIVYTVPATILFLSKVPAFFSPAVFQVILSSGVFFLGGVYCILFVSFCTGLYSALTNTNGTSFYSRIVDLVLLFLGCLVIAMIVKVMANHCLLPIGLSFSAILLYLSSGVGLRLLRSIAPEACLSWARKVLDVCSRIIFRFGYTNAPQTVPSFVPNIPMPTIEMTPVRERKEAVEAAILRQFRMLTKPAGWTEQQFALAQHTAPEIQERRAVLRKLHRVHAEAELLPLLETAEALAEKSICLAP